VFRRAKPQPLRPWYAKALAAFLAAYLLSPIDLIPDFVPVLGYLDDLVVISLGILVVPGCHAVYSARSRQNLLL
jgi:uncharacterized membrane protein YkvA (DUF1232 family)